MSKLRWGVLSTAGIATAKVIPGIRKAERCEVTAIASRVPGRAREVAERLGIPRWHGSYEALLADPAIDVVYVPLPNHLHAEWAIAAARAGKHVLCEKPLALTAADAQRMVDVARDEGVRLMEAFMYRLHPSWVAVRELLASGRIGGLVGVQVWFSYFNDDPANIRNMRDFGGGALFDIGCYAVNASRMLFGSEPVRVAAAIVRDARSGVDITTSGLLEFDGGASTFTCSIRADDGQRVQIVGSAGSVSVEIPFNIPMDGPTRITLSWGGDAGAVPPVAARTEVLTLPTTDPYACEAEQFAAAILDDLPTPTPPEDAVANLRVIERLFAAAEAPVDGMVAQLRAVPAK